MANGDPDPSDFTQGALAYMLRAAPERGELLRKMFADYEIRVRHTQGGEFQPGVRTDPSPYVAMGPIIHWPPVMHALAWLLAHAGWQAMRDYGTAIATLQASGLDVDGPQVEAIVANLPKSGRAHELIKCAVETAEGIIVPLPAWLPNIQDSDADGDTNREFDAVRELWLLSQVWMLFHELHHVQFEIEGERFETPIMEELACDAGASLWLLEAVEGYSKESREAPDKVLAKRAMGILIGLFCVGWLSETKGSDTHPPLVERINILFSDVGTSDAAYFWSFAVGLLFALSRDKSAIRIKAQPTIRDVALNLVDFI